MKESSAPTEAGSAFVAVPFERWRDVQAIHEEHAVAADKTVAWKGD